LNALAAPESASYSQLLRQSGARPLIFLTYDFVLFAAGFFLLYYLLKGRPQARLVLLIAGGFIFQLYYGGWVSIITVALLAFVTFWAARLGTKWALLGAIILCIGTLLGYKYTIFAASSLIGSFLPALGEELKTAAESIIPTVIPLGISFFTFEFVHYLVDVRKGHPPIRRLRDFLAFILFWPTIVAGPIKRYQQFRGGAP
jgi:alginate O-acetyltransferase complex protein AlgI